MPRLIPQVGDIWLYDTNQIYVGSSYGRYEHWLILKTGPANMLWDDPPDYRQLYNSRDFFYNSRDFGVYFLHLETGRYDAKIFYVREWGELNLYGNPYYKRVA